MTHYDYKVVPAPKRAKRVEGVKGAEELFALTLTDAINEVARQGWEYVRAEHLPAEAPGGWFRGGTAGEQTVLVFRRDREALGPRLAAVRRTRGRRAERCRAARRWHSPPSAPSSSGCRRPAAPRAAARATPPGRLGAEPRRRCGRRRGSGRRRLDAPCGAGPAFPPEPAAAPAITRGPAPARGRRPASSAASTLWTARLRSTRLRPSRLARAHHHAEVGLAALAPAAVAAVASLSSMTSRRSGSKACVSLRCRTRVMRRAVALIRLLAPMGLGPPRQMFTLSRPELPMSPRTPAE